MVANFITLIEVEEGWRDTPYPCSEGYPTVGFGFKLGPKLAKPSDIKMYNFKLPREAGEAWLNGYLKDMVADMAKYSVITNALANMQLSGTGMLSNARVAVLMSMCYQMGVPGVAAFVNTLGAMARGDWTAAAKGMLASKWARQTPERAQRHAKQMETGLWLPEYHK